jgi:3'-phosphoadenosine 5'-phosphosulfate sulfotransferase (PAPS reductase)/FAD synthetase
MQESLWEPVTVAEMQEKADEVMRKAKEQFKPVRTFACFSGGNDSTAMVKLVENHIDAAVHIKTGISVIDEGRTAFDHVKAFCEAEGIELIVLETPPSEYHSIILGELGKSPCQGFPSKAMHHVCYNRLKDRRIRDIQRNYSKKGETVLLVSGVRAQESARRARTSSKSIERPEKGRIAWANPITTLTSGDLAQIRQHYGLPQCDPSACIHMSGECLCGAFAKPGELEEIEFWFPETGKYIRELEAEVEKAGMPNCKWGQPPKKVVVLEMFEEVGPLCQGCQAKHEDRKDVS